MMKIESLYEVFKRYPSIQTDSRKVKEGDIFFALKGPNFNGNAYAQQAIEAGAAYAIVDEAGSTDDRIVLTDDVLSTLQALALHHRLQFDIPFIAITGSNGKTTTKELIHAVLGSAFTTYTTQGNLNNHIGIPLTILQVRKDAAFAVIEMGANHRGEIAGYCQYTLPTHGIITNCGKAHLEGFGGIEGVRKGKGELYDFLRENGGTAFAMWDYDYLRTMSKGINKIIKYGTHDADFTGTVLQAEPFLKVQMQKGIEAAEINTQLVGSYNLPNVLVAVAVGSYFAVPQKKIIKAIENYVPSNSRSQLLNWNDNSVILDAYNANPSSMKLAIENFAQLPAKNKVLLLGAMAELGNESIHEHQMIIDLIQQFQWNDVALVGGDFQKVVHPFHKFSDASEAGKWLRGLRLKGGYILVKGSRSMKMETALD
jgi:UDP-N-acetylmuramoyl-tripeptide--D-alanyl-D-alanine ligase